MRKLSPREMEPDMILLESVKTPIGQILAERGDVVTRQLINRMKLYKVEYALVEGEAPSSEASEEEPSEAIPAIDHEPESEPPHEEPKPAPQPPRKEDRPTPKLSQTTDPDRPVKVQQVEKNRARAAKLQGFEMQYYTSIEKMKLVFHDAMNQNSGIDTQDLLDTVAGLFRSRDTIIELFDLLYRMHTLNDSVYAHSLNVALTARMIGRWLHLEREMLDTLTIAGLLHDIGKMAIPEEILNKPDKLSDEEFALIKSHPQRGYEILKPLSLDWHVKNTALMHHERNDGSGYPSGLTGDKIDKMAQIIAIADVYDAMTAARSYRSPMCPFEVIYNFEQDGFQKYNTKYILTFLKQIAATYQSSRVVLNDGRGCKIVMLNQNNLSRPIVQFTDGTCLNLSHEKQLYIQRVIS